MRKWSIPCAQSDWPLRYLCVTSPENARCTRFYSTPRARRIADILDRAPDPGAPEQLQVNAFVRSVRRQKTRAFAAIGDGSSLKPLQAVLRPEQAQSLSTGQAVSFCGKWVTSRNPAQQAAELNVDDAKIMGQNEAETSPLQKKYQTLEFLRTVPHLRSRVPHNALLLRLRSDVIASVTRFFNQEGFVQTHTPIITSSDCEGAGEVFQVGEQRQLRSSASGDNEEYFGSPKYLTVSSQLHLEALAQSVGRVWTLSPTFRAEKSDTARHLSEFYMLEAEQCFANKLDEIMLTVEHLIKAITGDLLHSRVGDELAMWHGTQQKAEEDAIEPIDVRARWARLLDQNCWPRITYHEAVSTLHAATAQGHARFDMGVDDSSGLQTEHERYLANAVGQGGPIFVTDYPKAIKPFYMAPSDSDTGVHSPVETVACFDLLMPDVCEVVGGSMREHRWDVLESVMASKGLLGTTTSSEEADAVQANELKKQNDGQTTSLDWYIDLRRYGSVPHGGFGLGFDRLLTYLAGIKNVRDMVTFPRWYRRCDC